MNSGLVRASKDARLLSLNRRILSLSPTDTGLTGSMDAKLANTEENAKTTTHIHRIFHPLSNSDIKKIYNNLSVCSQNMHKWSFNTEFMNYFSMLISQNMHLQKERCHLMTVGCLKGQITIIFILSVQYKQVCWFVLLFFLWKDPLSCLRNKYWKKVLKIRFWFNFHRIGLFLLSDRQ